jgi:hypothetical protein
MVFKDYPRTEIINIVKPEEITSVQSGIQSDLEE